MDPWSDLYIFANGKPPSARDISRALDGRFLIEDWHNFGRVYDRTLMAWWANFDAAWPSLKQKCGERFHRRWRYYLMCCTGPFRSRQGQLWQLLFSMSQRPDLSAQCAEARCGAVTATLRFDQEPDSPAGRALGRAALHMQLRLKEGGR
jgi:hypothetical protein